MSKLSVFRINHYPVQSIKDWFHTNKKDIKFYGLIVSVIILIILLTYIFGLVAKCLGYYRLPNWIQYSVNAILSVVFVIYPFYVFSRKIWRKSPVKRDRYMFSHSGKGMLVYSLIGIGISILFLIAIANIWVENGTYIYKDKAGSHNMIWNVISHFTDPGNLPQSQNGGDVIALLSALAGIVCLSGLFVSSIVSIIARRTQQWKAGQIHYNYGFKNYVVIIGINEQTPSIVKSSLNQEGVEYVLIQTRKKVEEERAKLELYLEHENEKRIVFYYGDRALYEDVESLNLNLAKEVYILGEDMNYENEEDHDSYNVTCLEHIAQYSSSFSDNHSRLKCYVNFEYQSTFMAFKFTHIYRSLNEKIDFIPFNAHETWAKKVLVDNYAILSSGKHLQKRVLEYLPLDAYWGTDKETGRKKLKYIDEDSQRTVHLVVIGMNQMGVALAMQTALLVHLPNYHKNASRKLRTTITFIDDQAVKESEFLRGRYEALFSLCRFRTLVCGQNGVGDHPITPDSGWVDPLKEGPYAYMHEDFMDLQWEFIEGNIANPEIRNYLSSIAEDIENRTTTVAVCFNNPQKSIATALYLPKLVLRKALQILVYQQNSSDMIYKIATGEREWKRYEKLRPFGMMEECYTGNMFENTLAKLAVRVYKDRTLQYSNIDNLIDYLERLWDEEGIVYKLSNINLVDSFPLKLRSVGLSEYSPRSKWDSILNNSMKIKYLDMAEHSRWLTERLTMGYRPLYIDEMQFFLDDNTKLAKKAKKEYYKSKNRAHLDICSYELLEKVDNTLLNDHLIITNLLRQKFHKVEYEILCRIAFRSQTESVFKNERASLTWDIIKNMEEIPDHPKKLNKTKMWMGAHPVTQELWERVMHSNPSKNNKGGNYPVENVSMEDIKTFLFILNDITGLKFHLPKKEEWIYAALGGDPSHTFDKTGIGQVAWYNKNSEGQSHPVGMKKANKLGLYDMLGNVWEWTRTEHGQSTFCFCGGSWRFSEKECDLSDRNESWSNNWTPEFKSGDLGFRLMLLHEFKRNTSNVTELWKPEKWKVLKEIVSHMRRIDEGKFVMGTDEENVLEATNTSIHTLIDERPGHLINMSEYYIADAPFTQRQWIAFMGEKGNPSSNKKYSHPVENVSYIRANELIQKLNDYCKDELGISADCFDLPTEAQWEFAARGGGKHSGTITTYSGGNNADEVAWHDGITKRTHPVREKKPNDAGLYDMCGNVWEWCKDWYQSDYYAAFTEDNRDNQRDPQGPTNGFTRVMRGGSWRFAAGECRVTRRNHWTEDYEADHVGFRLKLCPEGCIELCAALNIGINTLEYKRD